MARLYYMSLPGVGSWFSALKEVGAQLSPYERFIKTALKAAERRKPVLGWREANEGESKVFQDRLRERNDERRRRASQSGRRRERREFPLPVGVWVVLEPPPWQTEEPDDTFDAFLDSSEVFEEEDCRSHIERRDFDREGRALLLDRLPEPVKADNEGVKATSESPHGALLWLKVNTYTLERQLHALWDLQNTPSSRLAPLIRLLSARPAWPDVQPVQIAEDEWAFLKTAANGELRDGTDEQRRFVSIASATPDFAIMEGPPGSGKTTAICELIVRLTKEGKRVLLVASTHVAVDNVL